MRSIRIVVGFSLVAAACAGSPGTTPSSITQPGTTQPGTTTMSTGSSTAGLAPTSTAQVTEAELLAIEITAAERGIRNSSLSIDQVAEFGRRQQFAYRTLARHPEWLDQVTELIPSDVAAAVEFNLLARQAVTDHAGGSSTTAPLDVSVPAQPDTLPAWTIVGPRPIDELLADYREAEQTTGVAWQYLAAINFVETRMGRIVGASSAGAVGPMQFLPSTWAQCCTGDSLDPRDAILGAARYLAASGAPADMHAALYAYNPNEGYVGSVTAYAQNMIADALAYRGYHAWQVLVGTDAGTVRLPVGYSATTPVDVAVYLQSHPDDLVP